MDLIHTRILRRASLLCAVSAVSCITLLLAGTTATAAPADDNLAGLQTENGRLARDFVDLWFNQHKPEEAFDRYVSHDRSVRDDATQRRRVAQCEWSRAACCDG